MPRVQAGILYDGTGPNQIWPSSVEFQIQEGATGDIYLGNSFALDVERWPASDRTPGAICRGSPLRNQVDLVVEGDRVKYYVNGKVVNEASETVVTKRKILFQSEGAEVYYRNIRLYPLQ